jgi:hypothetical protein
MNEVNLTKENIMFKQTMATVFNFNSLGEISRIRYIVIDVYTELDNQQSICC